MKRFALLLAAVAALLVSSPALGAPEIYLRNRPVKGAILQGSERYVLLSALKGLLTPEELARIAEADGGVTVDGQPVGASVPSPEGPRIPLMAVVKALGFDARLQKEMGIVDLVPPAAREKKKPVAGMKPGREHALARRRMQAALGAMRPIQDPKGQERIERIGRRIVEVTERPWVEWEFLIVSHPQANAATTGEGTLFVTDSLLKMNLDDDELAGVLAHEIAHGISRHPFHPDDMLAEYLGLDRDYKAFQREWATRPTVRDPSPGWIAAQQQVYDNRIAEFKKRLESLVHRLEHASEYEHAEEEEADIDGMRYAANAGFEPTGLMRALAKLEGSNIEAFGYGYSKTPGSWLPQSAAVPSPPQEARSHPTTARRLFILRKILDSLKR